jgi:hypothetical protein
MPFFFVSADCGISPVKPATGVRDGFGIYAASVRSQRFCSD